MRLRALVIACALAGGATGLPVARAGYPEACFAGVEGVARRALVAVEPGAAAGAVASVVRRAGGRIAAPLGALGIHHVEAPSAAARDALLPVLRGTPGVRWAEPDRAVRAGRTANDPVARHQWAIAKIGLRKAWDVEIGKAAVTVAVIDTGVAARHPDLRGKVLAGVDVVNGDSDASDDHGHGTHVAGTVAAASNNRLGVTGVAWGVRVLPVKVLGANGGGTSCDVAVGMVEAVERGASILNLSLGGPGACPLAFRAAVEYATYKKALVVAASGNDALQGAPSFSPANCPGVLGVGATDVKDLPGMFSSFGPQVDVSAPGVDIMSTVVDRKTGRFGYGAASGTSMAAPHVAGLAALLRSRHPDWTPQQVADRIVATSRDLGARGRDDFYGAGRIDAAKALGR